MHTVTVIDGYAELNAAYERAQRQVTIPPEPTIDMLESTLFADFVGHNKLLVKVYTAVRVQYMEHSCQRIDVAALDSESMPTYRVQATGSCMEVGKANDDSFSSRQSRSSFQR